MKYSEIKNLNLEKAIEVMKEETNDITDFDSLKEFAIYLLQGDNFNFALHIINSIYEANHDGYFTYDYSMGTLETPTPITEIEDLERFCYED